MANFAYVNGRYLPIENAQISIDDRGLQFGDSIYEVWALKDGKLLDNDGHLQRMHRSLALLQIEFHISDKSLAIIIKHLVSLSRVKNGLVYLQITRGTAPRDHQFAENTVANIIITLRPKNYKTLNERAGKGIKVALAPDERWGRVDIKTTNLLPNILGKQAAIDKGFDDVWFYDKSGNITEGSAQNAWIINKNGDLQTRALGNDILAGITRARVLQIAETKGIKVIEKSFKLQDALSASEAFVTSATSFVTPVIEIDNKKIGYGKVGEVAMALRAAYFSAK